MLTSNKTWGVFYILEIQKPNKGLTSTMTHTYLDKDNIHDPKQILLYLTLNRYTLKQIY